MVLEVKVHPEKKKDRVLGYKLPNFLEVELRAKPQNNQANEALKQLLSTIFKISEGQIKIIKGKTQPKKLVNLEGLDQSQFEVYIKKFLKKE
ncbi:DUF167 domain-containing protein [Thermodesulfobacterium sp. TA1]|uniref:DUF167 domain-containing protein n=1 Tax=Thermodesulfobacterium sp. TA1 TaxID=2234087 RepID=UPI0012326D91|nr:DUF167 family protein [Thermodesulfobacterium sp. TA1]QER41736.1 DUF167 domain-containing protein [Thermodesulfobacterium sp. TA1]